MNTKNDSPDAPAHAVVLPLKLERGHYKAIINRMEAYLVDRKDELCCHVESKEFDAAFKIAIEIRETQFWIEGFYEDMAEVEGD